MTSHNIKKEYKFFFFVLAVFSINPEVIIILKFSYLLI